MDLFRSFFINSNLVFTIYSYYSGVIQNFIMTCSLINRKDIQVKGIISYQIVFIAIIFVGLVPFTGCYKQPIEEKQVNVVFRFDDYSARSSTVMELRIIEAFRKIDSPITFGVIPFVCAGDLLDPSPENTVPLTSMKGNILKTGVKDGILDIALHGYSHQTINNEQKTEFSGLDYNSQVERLSKGKKFS